MQQLPNGKQQFVDQNGKPLAYGTVTFYAAGTTTPRQTWQDQAGTSLNTNPIQLDSLGQAIIWGRGTYRQVVKDYRGATIWDQLVACITNLQDSTVATKDMAIQQLSMYNDGDIIRVMSDETQGGIPTQYTVQGGNLVFSGPSDSAQKIAFDGGTVQDVLDSIKPMYDYVSLRTYSGTATGVRLTKPGIAGFFQRDATDISSTDNGGTLIVDARGRRWKRQFMEGVCICWFGGADDWTGLEGTDNKNALSALLAAYQSGCRIKFPKSGTGIYRFSTGYFALDKFTIDADPDVVLQFPSDAPTANPASKWERDTKLYFEDQRTSYVMKASASGAADFSANKSVFMGPGDRDTTIIDPLDNVIYGVDLFKLPWPDGPFVAGTGISVVDGQTIQMTGDMASMRVAAYPAVPGSEYSCWFDADTGFAGMLCFGVKTMNGYDIYYESADKPLTGGSHMIKEYGSAYVNGDVPMLDASNTSSYWAINGICTVRVVSSRSFVVLVNGVERFYQRSTGSPIESVIFGGGFSTVQMRVKHVTRMKHKTTRGQKPMRILTIGDSITDKKFHGNWPSYMAEALEGFMGIRVRELRNIAVSGDSSTQQLAALNSIDISIIDVAVILVGVNDIQSGVNPDIYIANVRSMLDKLNAANIPVVVGIPSMFYTRAQATNVTGFTGQGQASTNYDKGAPYRGKLMWEIAARNPALNKICWLHLEEMGHITARWLNQKEGCDPIVSDNIHPTAHGRRLVGYAIARAVAGALVPPSDATLSARAIPSAWAMNGWRLADNDSTFSINNAGQISFNGAIKRNGSAITSGLQVLQLPRRFWPERAVRAAVACGDAGGTMNGTAMLFASVIGEVRIFGVPTASEYIYMDALQYQLLWA